MAEPHYYLLTLPSRPDVVEECYLIARFVKASLMFDIGTINLSPCRSIADGRTKVLDKRYISLTARFK